MRLSKEWYIPVYKSLFAHAFLLHYGSFPHFAPPPPPPRKNPKTSEIFLRYMYIWTHDDFDHTLNLKDKSIISLYTKVHLVMLVSRFRTKCLGYTHSPNIILLCMSRGCLLQCKKKRGWDIMKNFSIKDFIDFFFNYMMWN